MQSINLLELRGLLQYSKQSLVEQGCKGIGGCIKIYVHWTAGHYHQKFEDYHLLVDKDGELLATVDDLSISLSHTYKRNTGGVGISALCAYKAFSTDDLGPEPPTDSQIETIAQVIAVISAELGLPITIKHFMTHAEAGDNMDGEKPPYAPNGYPDGKYGPDNSVERWDFWVVKQGDQPGTGGEILRGKAKWYAQNELSIE